MSLLAVLHEITPLHKYTVGGINIISHIPLPVKIPTPTKHREKQGRFSVEKQGRFFVFPKRSIHAGVILCFDCKSLPLSSVVS